MRRTIRHLEAVVENRPRAWPRTTVADGHGTIRRVNPAGYRKWKREVANKLAAFAAYQTFDGEMAVQIDLEAERFTIRIAALDEDDQRRPVALSGDIDNYAKAVLDALQTAGVITDDKAVASLEVRFRP